VISLFKETRRESTRILIVYSQTLNILEKVERRRIGSVGNMGR